MASCPIHLLSFLLTCIVLVILVCVYIPQQANIQEAESLLASYVKQGSTILEKKEYCTIFPSLLFSVGINRRKGLFCSLSPLIWFLQSFFLIVFIGFIWHCLSCNVTPACAYCSAGIKQVEWLCSFHLLHFLSLTWKISAIRPKKHNSLNIPPEKITVQQRCSAIIRRHFPEL